MLCLLSSLVTCWFLFTLICVCCHCGTDASTTTWAAPTSWSIQPSSAWEESSTATWDRLIRSESWSLVRPPTVFKPGSFALQQVAILVVVCLFAWKHWHQIHWYNGILQKFCVVIFSHLCFRTWFTVLQLYFNYKWSRVWTEKESNLAGWHFKESFSFIESYVMQKHW